MAAILDAITVGSTLILKVDGDPSAGGGTVSDIGTVAITDNGAGIYYKYGAGDTLWSKAQPLNAYLTSIAGLTPSNDDVIQLKSGAWINRTVVQILLDAIAPTLNYPILAAGTTTRPSFRQIAGTNETTPTAGDHEYDGVVFYSNPIAAERGISISKMFVNTVAGFNLQAATGVQSAFDTGMDVWTLAGSTTYRFRGMYSIPKSGNTCTIALAFALGGGASIDSIKYVVSSHGAAVNVTSTTSNKTEIAQVATTVVTATTIARQVIEFEGTIRMNAGGTVTPQIDFSAIPTSPSMGINSYIEFERIGLNTVTQVGNVG